MPALFAPSLQAAAAARSSPGLLDLTSGGLEALPQALLSFQDAVEDLVLNRNALGKADDPLEMLARLPRLRRLQLRHNQLRHLPAHLPKLTHLVHLDLGDNNIDALPEGVDGMAR